MPKPLWSKVITLASLLLWLVGCASEQPVLAQSMDKLAVLLEVNRVRIANGLAPFAPNPTIERAAQQHSDDMADKRFVDHTGSDGSSPADRLATAGYAAWPSTRVWGENVYASIQGFTEALDFFMSDETQRQNLLSTRYREIGIGVAIVSNASGTSTTYWTLTFGSQPNVLPIFINDGATVVNMPQVAIHLTQEEAVPGGEGNAMGSVIEVRLSADPNFPDVLWQKWEPLVPFTFDSTPGLKTVYVQLRDGGGRVTVSTASVQYDPNSTPQVVPLGPGAQITPALSIDLTPVETRTPIPIVAPVRTIAVDAKGSSPSQISTFTPAPIVMQQILATHSTAVINPTPTVFVTVQARPLVDRPDAVLPEWVLPSYLVAQALVIMLGVIAFLKMRANG